MEEMVLERLLLASARALGNSSEILLVNREFKIQSFSQFFCKGWIEEVYSFQKKDLRNNSILGYRGVILDSRPIFFPYLQRGLSKEQLRKHSCDLSRKGFFEKPLRLYGSPHIIDPQDFYDMRGI